MGKLKTHKTWNKSLRSREQFSRVDNKTSSVRSDLVFVTSTCICPVANAFTEKSKWRRAHDMPNAMCAFASGSNLQNIRRMRAETAQLSCLFTHAWTKKMTQRNEFDRMSATVISCVQQSANIAHVHFGAPSVEHEFDTLVRATPLVCFCCANGRSPNDAHAPP